MTVLGDRDPSDPVALLDAFCADEIAWRARVADARALADHLRTTSARIVVLHGPPKSGRTELLARWIIPLLTDSGARVAYRQAAERPADPQPADVLFWDDFDDASSGAGAEDEAIRELLAILRQERTKVILVIDENHLSRLFALSAVVPHALDDIRELPRSGPAHMREALPDLAQKHGVKVTPGVLEALHRDCSALHSAPMDPELVGVIAFEICRQAPPEGVFDVPQYSEAGCLTGLLEAHLDFLLQNVPGNPDVAIGWAVFERLIDPNQPATLELDDVAARFDCPTEVPADIVAWLETDRHILRRRKGGQLAFVHAELAAAAEARLQRDALALGWLRWTLRQGVRHFSESEALPSESNFRRLHQHRSALDVASDEAALMLRCALVYEQGEAEEAVDHWLRRVKHPAEQVDVLLGALFHNGPNVRGRAARALRHFARPEVRTQLHLLALRDPSDEVRLEAVNSLAAFKDAALRDTFIEETQQPGAPYRLQAIDALRLFDDAVTVAALGAIVERDRPDTDAEARRRALRVLSMQNTRAAADTLLRVALRDPDEDDRREAARALAALSDPATIAHVLGELRMHRAATHETRRKAGPPMPTRIAYALGAVAAILATVALHGLLFALARRWRPALALTAVGLAAWFGTNPMGGVIWAASLAAGILVPLRVLLNPGQPGTGGGPFLRALTGVLFGFAALTFFLVVHGLPDLLVRRYRRALAVTWCEAAGIIMVVVAARLMSEFAAFRSVSLVLYAEPLVLAFGGAAVLVGTYTAGLGSVLMRLFLARERTIARERIRTIYDEIVRNPAAAEAVLDGLRGSAASARRAAARILRDHGRKMHAAVQAAWAAGDTEFRRALFAVLARRRDSEALEMLRAVAPSLGWRARARYLRAHLAFGVSVWPRPLLIVLCLGLFTAAALGLALYEKDRYLPNSIARRLNAERDERRSARYVGMLEQLATQTADLAVARDAGAALTEALTGSAAAASLQLRIALVGAIARVAPRLEARPAADYVDAVASQLTSTDSQLAAIHALRDIGGVKAMNKLREFVERRQGTPLVRSRRSPLDGAPEPDRRRDALNALSVLPGAGYEPLRTLEALSTNAALERELREEAERARLEADPLMWAEYLVQDSYAAPQKYEEAMKAAKKVLATGQTEARTLRARYILREAALSQARVQVDQENYWTAKTAILEAITADNRAESNDEIRQVALSVTVGLHDILGPSNPAGYAATYEVLTALDGLRGESQLSALVKVNLVEASLTTQRYDEVLERVQRIKRAASPADTVAGIDLVVLDAFALMALELKKSRPEADRAYAELQKRLNAQRAPSTGGWNFGGTRTYIRRAGLEPARTARLLALFNRIENQGGR